MNITVGGNRRVCSPLFCLNSPPFVIPDLLRTAGRNLLRTTGLLLRKTFFLRLFKCSRSA